MRERVLHQRRGKRRIPAYVERAILWLGDRPAAVREIERLMPHMAYRVGAGLMNAYSERQTRINVRLSRKERLERERTLSEGNAEG